jgi:hypothetical protein
MPLQQKNPAIAGFFVEEGDEAKLRRHHWSDSLFVPQLRDFFVEEGGDAKASSAPLE